MTEAPRIRDDVRALDPDETAALLAHMDVDPRQPPDADLLERLQWGFLRASPFHNLELLAGRSPRTPEAAIDAVLGGRGGPCHVQSTAFLALVRSMGFDAHLAAATIGAPGDHMVVIARAGGRRWVCDVGNGHPYRRPFPLAGVRELEHVGWRFESHGNGSGLSLHRHFPDGRSKRVYRVDPRPRAFADFRGIIDGHHGTAGFGPFLTGLRAVRIDDDRLLTLRDLSLRRYSVAGERVRPVPDLNAAGRVLVQTFGFDAELVDAALDRVAPHRGAWTVTPPRPLNVAITVASDRPDTVAKLLADLARDAARANPAAVAAPVVHVLDNTADAADSLDSVVADARAQGLDVRLIEGERSTNRRPIAASRRAQVRAVARSMAAGEHVDAVWMLDDDLRLGRLERIDGRLAHIDDTCYLDDIAQHWWSHPEVSLLIGGVTGDPPIRPDAVFATQLLDLRANLERFATLAPDAGYHAPDQAAAFELPDFYYDHARTEGHLDVPFFWLPRGAGVRVRDAAAQCIGAMGQLFAGKTPTRPLTGVGGVPVGEPWLRRGGNAVFLDVDACLRHPYPCVEIDGWSTRRADMVGTALLHREGGTCAVGWAGSVRHARPAQPRGDAAERRDALRRSLVSEFYGVLLARAIVEDEQDLDACAQRRAQRIVDRLAIGVARLDDARAAIAEAMNGWMGDDQRVRMALEHLDTTLRAGRDIYFGGVDGIDAWQAEVEALLNASHHIERVRRFVATEMAVHVQSERQAVANVFDRGATR